VFIGNETIFCIGHRPNRVQVTPFTPTLSYNYLCGSTLLATYLPVYCYLYSIQLLTVPLNTLLLASQVPYTHLPHWARSKLSGVLWPHHWYATSGGGKGDEGVKERPTSRSLLTRDTVVNKYAEDILNLITFGLCCPLLGLAISLSMSLNLLIQRGLIGRFLLAREELAYAPHSSSSPPPPRSSDWRAISSSSSSLSVAPDLALLALNQSLLDLDSSYYHLLWVVLWSSCFFIAFLCWDIAGDTLGALESIWLPFLAVGFVITLRVVESDYGRWLWQRLPLFCGGGGGRRNQSLGPVRERGISLESLSGTSGAPYHQSGEGIFLT
jgi:hypothetical protein